MGLWYLYSTVTYRGNTYIYCVIEVVCLICRFQLCVVSSTFVSGVNLSYVDCDLSSTVPYHRNTYIYCVIDATCVYLSIEIVIYVLQFPIIEDLHSFCSIVRYGKKMNSISYHFTKMWCQCFQTEIVYYIHICTSISTSDIHSS